MMLLLYTFFHGNYLNYEKCACGNCSVFELSEISRRIEEFGVSEICTKLTCNSQPNLADQNVLLAAICTP